VVRLDPNLEYRVVQSATPYSCGWCSFMRSSRASPCPTGFSTAADSKAVFTPVRIMSVLLAASLMAVAVMASQWPRGNSSDSSSKR
jgi:hypothetical protein